MMERIVNYKIERTMIYKDLSDTYVLNHKNKFINWLVKLLLKKKVISQYQETSLKYERAEIKKDKVIDLIRHLERDIYRTTSNKPISIIIGFDKFRQLEIECYEEIKFTMPFEMMGNEGRKIFGLNIVLNPRIDGLVLINS
jgi:hypothetical protein